MRKFAKLFGLLLTAILTVACSDDDDSPSQPDSGTFSQATVTVPSEATPAFTPGTAGVVVDNEKMLRQFGVRRDKLQSRDLYALFLVEQGWRHNRMQLSCLFPASRVARRISTC